MILRLPYLFLTTGIAVSVYAAWILVDHAIARRSWDRIVARVPASELRRVEVITGSYGNPTVRIAHLDYAIAGDDGPPEQEILITPSVPYRVRQPRWSTVLFPAFVLTIAATAAVAIGLVLLSWSRRPDRDPHWRLTSIAPAASPNAVTYSLPRSVVKANLMWASFGLLGVIPNFLGQVYPWMWVASIAFSALYCGVFLLLAWHNATCRYWVTANGLAAVSSLGAQFVPFSVIGKITDHSWRDVRRRRGDSMQVRRRSVGQLVSRNYRIYDHAGGLLIALSRELQPSLQPVVDVLVRKTGLEILPETTTTTTHDD